jgi:hypothetical protein
MTDQIGMKTNTGGKTLGLMLEPAATQSRLFWGGLILLNIGVPLAVAMLFSRDPNLNPLGLALLVFVTFWPVIIMIAVGWDRSYRSSRCLDGVAWSRGHEARASDKFP